MDLGIAGKWAVVCASSKGLGRACAESLAEAGVNLIVNARNSQVLEEAAKSMSDQHRVQVEAVAADVATSEGRAEIFKACANPDILVTNAGGPPAGHWSDWDRDDYIAALDQNMLGPIDMMKRTMPGMIEKRWGRIVNITSASVRSPIEVLGLSNTARTGLTGFVAGTSRQVAQYGITINNLLPGVHATDRAEYLDADAARKTGTTVEETKAQREAGIPAKRYGLPEELGAMCAFLCSQHAGYIVGQNLLLDGGAASITI